MTQRKAILGSLPMSRVFLPGTHDSASYAVHEQANSENIVERYVITQVNSELINTEDIYLELDKFQIIRKVNLAATTSRWKLHGY